MTTKLVEADIVMQGGVTSGVVFPTALSELGQAFRFRRIGGASAGAIAAAALAAAEYRRQRQLESGNEAGSGTSFETLRQLGERLAEPLDAADPDGRRVLEGLFTPDGPTERLYAGGRALLDREPAKAVAALFYNRPGLTTALSELEQAGLLLRLQTWVRGRPWGELLTPLLGEAAGRPPSLWWSGLALLMVYLGLLAVASLLFSQWVPMVWASLLGGFLALGVTIGITALVVTRKIRHLRRAWTAFSGEVASAIPEGIQGLAGNSFGLSTGYGSGEAFKLTPWLHHALQDLCGEPGGILTFGQLRQKNIELKLMTTCLSRQRPYVLPLDPRGGDVKNIYFRPDEWARFFPWEIIEHMMRSAERVFTAPDDDSDPVVDHRWKYYRLPPEHTLPVLVATRLSMSFPVLFSTLPMYFITWTEAPGASSTNAFTLKRDAAQNETILPVSARIFPMLFSDGGLTSNFPLMLFDDPAPERPLLALNLQYRAKDQPTFLAGPKKWLYYNRPINTLFEFGAAILDTSKNWFDQSILGLDGYGERTASITLSQGEGGLNLSMSSDAIHTLLGKGRDAGRRLRMRFADQTSPPDDWSFGPLQAGHWLRLTNDLGGLLEDHQKVYRYDRQNVSTWIGLLPAASRRRLSQGDALLPELSAEDHSALEALASAAQAVGHSRALGSRLFVAATEQQALLRYRPFL